MYLYTKRNKTKVKPPPQHHSDSEDSDDLNKRAQQQLARKLKKTQEAYTVELVRPVAFFLMLLEVVSVCRVMPSQRHHTVQVVAISLPVTVTGTMAQPATRI
jgi:hypothetical protein